MSVELERLKAGIRTFRKDVYPGRAEQFEAAMLEQQPHSLIITCADSRIHPDVLTQSEPGEIFVTRNIGNMVPAYGDMLGGVSAVLEFAVSALKVRHVVVCGHSECGAMKALLNPKSVEQMPTVQHWLRNAHAALSVVQATSGDEISEAERVKRLCEQNVLLQMQHLKTHPSVAGALARGELSISGWYYEIAKGQVLISEGEDGGFEPVTIAGESA
jgi:carbonic anhydrase